MTGNTAEFGGAVYMDRTASAGCSQLRGFLIDGNAAAVAGGGFFFDTSTAQRNCSSELLDETALSQSSNPAPYGAQRGSLPAELVVLQAPKQPHLRLGAPFRLLFQLVDIFAAPVVHASGRFSFEAVAAPAPPLAVQGLVFATPRDVDGLVDFRRLALVAGSEAALPLRDAAVSVTMQPPLLAPVQFNVSVLPCQGAYRTVTVADGGGDAPQVTCARVDDAADWARILVAVVAAVALLLCAAAALLLLYAHTTVDASALRRLDAGALLLVLCGAVVTLASLFLWQRDTDGLCMARPWLAGVGFSLSYAAVLALLLVACAQARRGANRPAGVGGALLLVAGVALLGDVVVLATWTAADPLRVVDTYSPGANSVRVLCQSSSAGYVAALVAWNGLLLAAALLFALVNRTVPLAFREPKHLRFAVFHTCIIYAALVPVAVVLFDEPTPFYLVVTLGLAAAALVPVLAVAWSRFNDIRLWAAKESGGRVSTTRRYEAEIMSLQVQLSSLKNENFISGLSTTPTLPVSTTVS